MKRIKNRTNKVLLAALSLCVMSAGCDFDEINTNPDAPTTATPAMLAAAQIGNALIKENNGKGFFIDHMYSKHISFAEAAETSQYNDFGTWGFGVYTNLTNALKMVEIADEIDKDAYTGLFLFLKAHNLIGLTLGVGDIPYSEALQALDGITAPKYDTQKEVMRQILDDLDAAYEHFSKATRPFSGDITHFDGDPQKWQRAVSMLQLKVLISLSKKDSDPDLNVKARFTDIATNRQLQLSNDDNVQITYGEQASSQYPLWVAGGNRNAMYPNMTNTVMAPLKQHEDYRLFSLVEPKANLAQGVPEGDTAAYGCVDPSWVFSAITSSRNAGNVSLLNNRFFEIQKGQPAIRHGYAEQNFILAEARLRGWISSSNANDYYKEGIRANMQFIKQHTPERYAHGRPITDSWIETFLQKPELQLSSANADFEVDLEKILTQKYIAAFMNDTYFTYFDYRRTGYPRLPINTETNRNVVRDKMPVRWLYAQEEYQYNRENVLEAVQRQFNGNDEVNQLMWILKEE